MKLAILLYLFSLTLVSCLPWIPEPQTQQDWMPWNWMERHEENVNNTLNNGENIQLMFFGDSITEGWAYTGTPTWNQYFAPLRAVNYGIGGDATQHVLWRIINGEVQGLNPRLVVLKIGTNNAWSDNEFDISRGIAAIVNELRGRLTNTKVLLLGVLPRVHNGDDYTAWTERINAHVSILDNGNTVRFLNMNSAFYANGSFVEELFTEDLLHLAPAGYVKWHEVMNPLFQEMWTSP